MLMMVGIGVANLSGCVGLQSDAPGSGQLAKLRDDSGSVESIAFSPDGSTLACASGYGDGDGGVRFWDVPRRRIRAFFPKDPVTSIAYSPLGSSVAATADQVLLLDPETGKLHGPLRGTQGKGNESFVAFSPQGDRLATAGWDHCIRLWDVRTLRQEAVLQGHSAHVLAVVFTVDGKSLVSIGADRELRLWNIGSGKSVLIAGNLPAFDLAVSPNGRSVVVGTSGSKADPKTVSVFSLPSGSPEAGKPISLQTDGVVMAVAYSPDGKQLAVGSGSVQLWDLVGGKQLRSWNVTGIVESLCFSPDGRTLAAGIDDGTVTLYGGFTTPSAATAQGTV